MSDGQTRFSNLMRQRSGRIVASAALLGMLATTSALADDVERLAALMQGRFDSHPPNAGTTDAEQRFVDSRQRADAPELGDVVFYLQLNRGADLELYRQRILVFTEHEGRIEQRAYTLKDPSQFVDAKTGDDRLRGIRTTDIEPMFAEGCAQTWTATDDGFAGHTNPATCRIISSRTGNPRRIEAETILRRESLALAERGFDDDMNQLFGTPPGEVTTLYRVE